MKITEPEWPTKWTKSANYYLWGLCVSIGACFVCVCACFCMYKFMCSFVHYDYRRCPSSHYAFSDQIKSQRGWDVLAIPALKLHHSLLLSRAPNFCPPPFTDPMRLRNDQMLRFIFFPSSDECNSAEPEKKPLYKHLLDACVQGQRMRPSWRKNTHVR